jgi:hypothetical protein
MEPAELRDHLDHLDARATEQARRELDALARRLWPDPRDGTSSARSWVTLWRPRSPGVLPPACGCAAGRCLICG